jgi:hypothetical protein
MSAEILERELIADLESLGDRFTDEKFCTELYRALTRTKWTKDGFDGHVALSFKLAEEIINTLRAQQARPPLPLAGSGGEGDVDDTVEDALGPLGWRWEPLDTSRHDDEHLASPEDPPPPRAGRRPDAGRWAEEAHVAAEAQRARRDSAAEIERHRRQRR